MYQVKSEIISNKEIAPGHFLMVLSAPKVARAAKPGQFVHVKITQGTDPLLRRPFSIHRVCRSKSPALNVEILYKVVGQGTRILSAGKKGEKLDLLGPLGNGFDSKKPAILVAGGMGVAPLAFLAEKLKNTKRGDIFVIIGARNKKALVCEQEFKKQGIKTIICTDDGSKGKKALASEALEELITFNPQIKARRFMIYACGPNPMLMAVAKVAERKKILCQVSLEEKMACGVGACMGCAVKTREGFKMVCKDGPVFDAREIVWR